MLSPLSFSYLNQSFLDTQLEFLKKSLNKTIEMNLSFWISFLLVSAIAWNNELDVAKRVRNEQSRFDNQTRRICKTLIVVNLGNKLR